MSGDNGELSDGEKAIQTGHVCGACESRYPEGKIMAIAMITPPKLISNGKLPPPEGTMVVLCSNPKSNNYQHILSVHGTCNQCHVPKVVDVPEKIKNRIKSD